jgi:hypothetical protein
VSSYEALSTKLPLIQQQKTLPPTYGIYAAENA